MASLLPVPETLPGLHEPRDQNTDEWRDRNGRLLLDTELSAEQKEYGETIHLR